MSVSSRRIINLEEGWKVLEEEGIEKLKTLLKDGLTSRSRDVFKPAHYTAIYTKCYDMCTQRTPYNWSEELYNRHGKAFQTYLDKVVLPAFKSQHEVSARFSFFVNHREDVRHDDTTKNRHRVPF